MIEYWIDCLEEALEYAGVEAKPGQVKIVASWIEGAHENFAMAHGMDRTCSPASESLEIAELKRALKEQQERYERQMDGVRK